MLHDCQNDINISTSQLLYARTAETNVLINNYINLAEFKARTREII